MFESRNESATNYGQRDGRTSEKELMIKKNVTQSRIE
jgi:hypothetical protein